MERKFKVGDEVIVIKCDPCCLDNGGYVGKKFKIKGVSNSIYLKYPYVLVDENGKDNDLSWRDGELELVKEAVEPVKTNFKVGDRVTVIKDSKNFAPKGYTGETGVIVEIGNSDLLHRIKFEKRINGFDRWYFEEDELKLVAKTKVETVENKKDKFSKKDLKPRFIVKLRSGDTYVISNTFKTMMLTKNGVVDNRVFISLDDFKEDNKHINNDMKDIVEVYKPEYKTIYTREENNMFNITKEFEDLMKKN